MSKYTITPQPKNFKEFSVAQTQISSSFIFRKIALCAIALNGRGMSWGDIAKTLELDNPKSTQLIARKYAPKEYYSVGGRNE